ncbi:uncharacterized protein LOC131929658 [Physella acuta]|uniref:uncharacterized protein LOC131929658 n=1 Tax=Physella acuta TaxID=109671 RepID=UPI0027DD35B1|nr:uncharacterized protein LOC131929658 [Physella acuta]
MYCENTEINHPDGMKSLTDFQNLEVAPGTLVFTDNPSPEIKEESTELEVTLCSCAFCPFTTTTFVELNKHLEENVHDAMPSEQVINNSKAQKNYPSRDKMQVCALDKVSFNQSPQDLNLSHSALNYIHVQADKDKCYGCELCPFLTYSIEILQLHMQSKHGNFPAKVCPVVVTRQMSSQIRLEDAIFYKSMSDNNLFVNEMLSPPSFSNQNLNTLQPFHNNFPVATIDKHQCKCDSSNEVISLLSNFFKVANNAFLQNSSTQLEKNQSSSLNKSHENCSCGHGNATLKNQSLAGVKDFSESYSHHQPSSTYTQNIAKNSVSNSVNHENNVTADRQIMPNDYSLETQNVQSTHSNIIRNYPDVKSKQGFLPPVQQRAFVQVPPVGVDQGAKQSIPTEFVPVEKHPPSAIRSYNSYNERIPISGGNSRQQQAPYTHTYETADPHQNKEKTPHYSQPKRIKFDDSDLMDHFSQIGAAKDTKNKPITQKQKDTPIPASTLKFSYVCLHCGQDQGFLSKLKMHVKSSHSNSVLIPLTNISSGQLYFMCPQANCQTLTCVEAQIAEHVSKCTQIQKQVIFSAIANLKSIRVSHCEIRKNINQPNFSNQTVDNIKSTQTVIDQSNRKTPNRDFSRPLQSKQQTNKLIYTQRSANAVINSLLPPNLPPQLDQQKPHCDYIGEKSTEKQAIYEENPPSLTIASSGPSEMPRVPDNLPLERGQEKSRPLPDDPVKKSTESPVVGEQRPRTLSLSLTPISTSHLKTETKPDNTIEERPPQKGYNEKADENKQLTSEKKKTPHSIASEGNDLESEEEQPIEKTQKRQCTRRKTKKKEAKSEQQSTVQNTKKSGKKAKKQDSTDLSSNSYKCWLCSYKSDASISVKKHIVRQHSEGLCAIDITGSETTGITQLLLFCPKNCTYSTDSLEEYLNHAEMCKKKNMASDHGRRYTYINKIFIDSIYPELLNTNSSVLVDEEEPSEIVKKFITQD